LTSGNTYNIEWDTYGISKAIFNILLKYTINGGKTWKTIGTIQGNDPGNYLWTVPTVLTAKNGCRVNILLKDVNGNNLGTDFSDGYFVIEP
jgi:hypothetical protein